MSEFTEKFETIEQTLKFIADTQAKSEWISKQNQIKRNKEEDKWNKHFEEMRALQRETQIQIANNSRQIDKTNKQIDNISKQLNHITKLTGIALDDLEFQNEKIDSAGQILSRKNPKRI